MLVSSSLLSAEIDRGMFCHSTRVAVPRPRTMEEGIRIIKLILRRELLCRHEIADLNRVYEEMTQQPGFSREQILKELEQRIKILSSATEVRSQITFYFLQTYGHNDLRIVRNYKHIISTVAPTPQKSEEFAHYLPTCSSEKEFEQDVSALIGPYRNSIVIELLQEKQRQLRHQTEVRQQTSQKRLELEELGRTLRGGLPHYLDQLLSKCYVRLVDHLLKMRALPNHNTRRSATEVMSFAEICQVILETRDSICESVESALTAHNAKVLFILGRTGAGKSTTLCAFRGDLMTSVHGRYVSQSDANALIGHEGATSCTFLPTVESVKGWVIVDFPGFDDTNGPLVSIGMECALKALVTKLNPHVLVLEPINNTEGRYSNAAQMGRTLKRLFGDEHRCVLGLTKYSEESNFVQIKLLEQFEQEDAAKKQEITPEENALQVQIKLLKEMWTEAKEFQEKERCANKLQQKEAELAILRHKRETEPPQLSANQLQIRERKKLLKEKELELRKQMGLKRVIRLRNLEDPQQVSKVFSRLSKIGSAVGVASAQQMDDIDSGLLDRRFRENLLVELLGREDYRTEYRDLAVFELSVLEASLTKTLCHQMYPEIGRFLHLSEVDPMIVRRFDTQLVNGCISRCMNFVVSTIQMDPIRQLLVLARGSDSVSYQKIEALEKKIANLRNYVSVSLNGISFDVDPVKAEKEWLDIQRNLQKAENAAQVQLPTWMVNMFKISNKAFNIIYQWLDTKVRRRAVSAAINETIDGCCLEVDEMYESLQRLNDIKKMIEKQTDFDNAVQSVQLSTESLDSLRESMQARIEAVASVYGLNEWNRRVDFLAGKLELNGFNPAIKEHRSCILAYAYWLIESKVQCVFQIEIEQGDSRSLNERVDDMVRELKTLQNSVRILGQKVPLDWNSVRSSIGVIGEILKKIELKAIQETERGVEYFTDTEHSGQNEVVRHFAAAVKDAALLADKLTREPIGGTGDLDLLLSKMESVFPIIKIKGSTKAVVTSWTSWARAQVKASKMDMLHTSDRKSKKRLDFRLTLYKKIQTSSSQNKRQQVLSILCSSQLPELTREIREIHEINRPLIRVLHAAALLKASDMFLNRN